MADPALRESPLLVLAGELADISCKSTVVLKEVPFLAQISLRGDPENNAFLDRVAKALGLALPLSANTFNSAGEVSGLWLGPDEWLIVGPDGSQTQMVDGLALKLKGFHNSVADISANRTVLEISGPDALHVLQKGCLLDLHPRVFVPGHCVGTVIAQTQVFLQQVDLLPTYRLFVRCSYARHLTKWLLNAMAEFARGGGELSI